MKSEWQKEIVGFYPPQFDQVNNTTYIQRRNIHAAPNMEDGTSAGYVCESRFISKDIYDEFMETLNTPAQEQVIANQEASSSDQIAIMEALADLYDLIGTIAIEEE